MEHENHPEGFDPDDFTNDSLDISGTPQLGNRVDISYESSAGGSFRSSGETEIGGELLYVEGDIDDRLAFVVRDRESNRSVAFSLREGSVGQVRIRSLKAHKSRWGRKIGKANSIDFTDETVDVFSPVINVLRDVIPGDTILLDGDEYGVVSKTEYGPEYRKDRFSAILTQPDGEEFVLDANPRHNDSPEFSVRFGDDLDLNSVRSGRKRERWFDEGNEDREVTDDAFPAPHYGREGDEIEFYLLHDDGYRDKVQGTITDVNYYEYESSRILSGRRQKNTPETTVELVDGREVKLTNVSRSSNWVTRSRFEKMDKGYVKAFVIERSEDGENEYDHVEAEGISLIDGSDRGVENGDEPVALTDGGKKIEKVFCRSDEEGVWTAEIHGKEKGSGETLADALRDLADDIENKEKETATDGGQDQVYPKDLEPGHVIKITRETRSGSTKMDVGVVEDIETNQAGELLYAYVETEDSVFSIDPMGSLWTIGDNARPFADVEEIVLLGVNPPSVEEVRSEFGFDPDDPPCPIHRGVGGLPYWFAGKDYNARERVRKRIESHGYEWFHPDDGRFHDGIDYRTFVVVGESV